MTSLDPLSLLRPKPDPGRSPAGDEAGGRASPDFGAMLDAFETRSAPEEPDVSGEAKELKPPPPPADTGDVSGSDNVGADLRELMALTAPVPATPPVPPDASLTAVVQRAVARGNANATAEAPRPELRITLVGVETHFAPVRPAAVAEVAQATPSTAATGVPARPQTEAFGIQAGLIGSAPMPDALDRPITAAKFTTGTGTGDASNGALSAQADRGLVPDRTVHEHAAVVPNVADRGARSAGLGDPTEARLALASKGSASERPPQISPQPAVLADRVAIETGAGHGRPLRAAGYSPPARGEVDARDFTGDAASTDDWSVADRPAVGSVAALQTATPSSASTSARLPASGSPVGVPSASGSETPATSDSPNGAGDLVDVSADRSDAVFDTRSSAQDAIPPAQRPEAAQAAEKGRREPAIASDRSFGTTPTAEAIPASSGSAETVAAPSAPSMPASPLRQIVDAVSAQFPAAAPATPARTGIPLEAGPLRILTLQLHPADLGTVLVRMRLQDGRLEMNLRTGREETAERLRREGGALSALLQEAGYAPQSLTIEASHPATGTTAERGTAQNGLAGGQARDQGGAAPDQQPGRRPFRQEDGAAPHAREQDHDTTSRAGDRGGVYL